VVVAFHSNTLTVRGSENALWDYAEFNETLLGHRSVLAVADRPGIDENPTFARWQSRFPTILYQSRQDLARKLRQAGAEVLYMIKPGHFDGLLVPGVKNCIHAMFLSDEFHGDRFAYVSAWASAVMTGREESFVPHFVPCLKSNRNMRDRLKIPKCARVFGRHGGTETFNIPFVHMVVGSHAKKFPGDHFVFLNTNPVRGTERLPNVHYLPATLDPNVKAEFLATCDAMIHARDTGETFGLAVGEFAVLGKPVITFGGSRERAHLAMLGPRALAYGSSGELKRILVNFTPHQAFDTGYQVYTDPEKIMEIFSNKFLE
jgi:hypothetical protein